MGLERIIFLYLLVAVHTKNRWDGVLGHVERKLKTVTVNCPRERMKVIEEIRRIQRGGKRRGGKGVR